MQMYSESTNCGLMKWFQSEIEEFGWMVIKSNKPNTHIINKINLYLETLSYLKKSIEEKIIQVEEKDRKDDLVIILNKLNDFIPVATETLTNNLNRKSIQQGGARKKSSKKGSRKSSKKGSRKSKK
jgi:hypothetical protein